MRRSSGAKKQSERRHKSLELLQSVTGMAALPLRLEAYDISNFAGQDTVGSMIVFVEGQPKKSDYRKFRIACAANGQDDYASMREMLTRRVQRYADGDEKFAPPPNAFMIDGGLGHVRICKEVLDSFGLSVPCFGMVKDDHHRTRALIAPDGREFGIRQRLRCSRLSAGCRRRCTASPSSTTESSAESVCAARRSTGYPEWATSAARSC